MAPSSQKTQSSSSAKSPSAAAAASKKQPQKIVVNPAQFKRRLESEYRYIKNHSKDASCKYKLIGTEADHRRWTLLFMPDKEPYVHGAYKMIVDFPPEYPFRPPSLIFQTRTYHPNIAEKGNMDLNLCRAEQWKPTTRMHQLFDHILYLLNYPQSIGAVRKEIGEQMQKNRETFLQEAATYAKNNSEARI